MQTSRGLPGTFNTMRVAVIVPTLNAGERWTSWLDALRAQSLPPREVLVVDSSSSDNTQELAAKAGLRVHQISRKDFGHGVTRQLALDLIGDTDIAVYLTQDAILASEYSLELLAGSFQDPTVGAAYGRQLPRRGAGPFETHSRLFNYPESSQVYTKADSSRYGIRCVFMSNSFGAYRIKALREVGGFPRNTIFAEDMYVAAKMLNHGWSLAYVAQATVEHSHDYTIRQEFARSFDIGVFHTREPWILGDFGSAEGVGRQYIFSELRYVASKRPWLLPSTLARQLAKWLGYRMGIQEKWLPPPIKKGLSLQKWYWQ